MVDSERGKIFVGGISWETTETILRDYFSRYGYVSSATIAKDRFSGTPRGFGFITFADSSCADKALNDHHEISGRTVEVKRAIPRSEQLQHHQSRQESGFNSSCSNSDYQFRTKKIFVGGLSANLTEEQFKSYFEKFGRIIDVVVMHDNVTNRPRGFGFITFDSEDVVDKITKNSFYELGGKCVEVKRAIPKDLSRNVSNGQNSRTGGGRASPYGSYWQDNYRPDDVHYGFYPSHGYTYSYGYCGVYDSGYHMAGPGYGSVGYGLPMVASMNPWNGLGMLGYGSLPYDPASIYHMNGVSGAGSLDVCNGVGNSVEIRELDRDGGSNYDVPDNDSTSTAEDSTPNCNESPIPRMRQSVNHNNRTKRSSTGNKSHSFEGISAECCDELDS